MYPTQIVTAYGKTIQRTAAAEYDFFTGLVKKSTDVDNNVSTEMQHDALGRTTKVKEAVGTPQEIWTQTAYDDVNRRVIVKSDVGIKEDGRQVTAQFYDQLGRVRLTKTLENAATQNATNETDGIKVQTRYLTSNPSSYQFTSNPYRAATSGGASGEESVGWTRSKISNTGRRMEVETFSGAAFPGIVTNSPRSTGIISTDIDAERTLVTDQAGKQRISQMNALGQLMNIWEIKAAEAGQTEAISFGSPALALNGYRTSYNYDTLSNLTTVNQGAQTRTFDYDSLSRLKDASNPESGYIYYTYDDNGNLQTKHDARGIKTIYDYDALNRVIKKCYRLAPGETLGATNCTSAGSETAEPNTPDVTYTYDNLTNSKGRLTKIVTGAESSPFSVTDYQAFDKLGRVTQSRQSTDGTAPDAMTYKYNLAGALIEEKYPSGRIVKNVLAADGDLSTVRSSKNGSPDFFMYAKNFTYTAAGAVSSMQLGNGRWESAIFNSRLQPTQIALGMSKDGIDLLKLAFTYNTPGTADNNGNVLSQKITKPAETIGGQSSAGFTATQNYIYDSLNRIKQATETIAGQTPVSWQQTFTYDRYGNRSLDETNTTESSFFHKNCANGSSQAVVCTNEAVLYNPAASATNNRLTGYQFDAVGNMMKDAKPRAYTYDGENRQTKVESIIGGGGGGETHYTLGTYFYDGDGKRVKKVVGEGAGAETTIFVYDASGRLVAEYSTTVAPTATAQVSYLTSDHLGSPRINTDRDGKVTARHDYQPFGEEVARSGYGGDDVKQKFTSYERDKESDLDFAQARYYTSSLGRFQSSDPLMASATKLNPQSFNRYSYVINNPLLYSDSTGEDYKFCDQNGKNCQSTINTDKEFGAAVATGEFKFKNGEIFGRDGVKYGTYFYVNGGGEALGTGPGRAERTIGGGILGILGGILGGSTTAAVGGAGGSGIIGAIIGGQSILGGSSGGSGGGSTTKNGFSGPNAKNEQVIADYLENECGCKVAKNPFEGTPGQGDALVDGHNVEFKTLKSEGKNAEIQLKNAVESSLDRHHKQGQGRDFLIDARNTSMTSVQAGSAANRTNGNNKGKIDSITVIGRDFFRVFEY